MSEQMHLDDPIINAIEEGLRGRCAGVKTNGERCKRTAPAWYSTGTTPWFCRTHEEQGR